MEIKVSRIKKRSGEIVDFDKDKIKTAVFKAVTASKAGDGDLSKKVSDRVIDLINRRFKKDEIPTVEQVQDIVEEVLILEGLVETAKAFILYREKRREIREAASSFDESIDTIDKYLDELDWQVKENANMTYSLQGLNQYTVSQIARKYWLNKIYPENIRQSVFDGDFHIHDLDSLATYCCGWDLQDLLVRGFGGVPSKIESKPAKHLKTALGQIVNFFYTLQGECYSDDTEVLTDSGWKFFYDVSPQDKAFTLNTENDRIELQKPTQFFEFDFNGNLYNFKSKKIDLLVTPNHNMLVKQYYPGKNDYSYKFVKAKDFNPNAHFLVQKDFQENTPYYLKKKKPVLAGNLHQEKSLSSEIEIKMDAHFQVENIEEISYQGKVYCLEVPNHTLYVRRNGRAAWCGNSAGAQAMSNFDTFLAPFIRYDNLSYHQVKQAMQEFLFNSMVPTRVGFQTPFLNLSLDIKVPRFLKDSPVIIGGKVQDKNYGEFQPEMDMLNRAFYEVIMEGDSKGRPFTFPIPTISITKDFDWDNPTLDPMWEATAKYGINYFSNFVQSDMDPEDFRSMCCRLRLDNKELIKRGGGLFGSQPLTGSVGVCTVDLPKIGYLSKTKKEFFKRLDDVMVLAKESLEIKRKSLDNFIEKGLYPYSRHYLSSVKKMRGSYYGNHFSTIGLLGTNEAILNFMGENIGTKKGKEFAKEILDFMRNRLVDFQKETGNLYNLEATPAEGASFKLARIDRQKYPDIITAGTKEVPYYTNSTHLPVNYTDDIFEALDHQDQLQCSYTGGTVAHLFLGESLPDIESVKKLVRKVFEKYHLPYITITPTFSICPTHGYLSGKKFTCPKCTIEQPCEVYSRIVGYLRPVNQWHAGKQQEFKERKEYQDKKK
jgi:anaerobic ribonucleoside-triphosphate reductase